MTRKDCELIARAMFHARPTERESVPGTYIQRLSQWNRDRIALGNMLAAQNARFNSAVFFHDCKNG